MMSLIIWINIGKHMYFEWNFILGNSFFMTVLLKKQENLWAA
ncbi:hypothetical protein HMPREF9104_02501 [Lentilactobacillus kisonensis F0435]|uniref:Uncharacterized protein n=1 Tax=Lentilactobacillus kisonensis F0435 TaxID=797516 RepID=H1LIR0_9LACO|nr:hypothetical protein HMPREF9104_02501 [Lentilactobacillus kisonensis F0435]